MEETMNNQAHEAEITTTNVEAPKAKSNKKLHIIYGIIIFIMLAAMVVSGIITSNKYEESVRKSKKEYKAAKEEYEEAYARVLEEEAAWKTELSESKEYSESVTKELEDIYAERQAEKDAEEARWNALSEEEQNAEKLCIAYNEMVSELRATNEEYAKLYVKYASYINQDIFNLDKKELFEYTDMYEKKVSIEKEYMEAHK